MKTNEIKLHFKTLTATASEVDARKRTVCAYASSFLTIDASAEIVMPGAFKDSIAERGVNGKSMRRIVHLWAHDQTRPIGKITVLRETKDGLYFESRIFDDDVLMMYEDNVINQHSIGFNYGEDAFARKGSSLWNHVFEVCKNKKDMDRLDEIRVLSLVDLFELSSVAIGLNEFTPTVGLKAIEETNYSNILTYAAKNFKM